MQPNLAGQAYQKLYHQVYPALHFICHQLRTFYPKGVALIPDFGSIGHRRRWVTLDAIWPPGLQGDFLMMSSHDFFYVWAWFTVIRHGPIKQIELIWLSNTKYINPNLCSHHGTRRLILKRYHIRTIYTFFRQGEYDIALVDREGNQLYFGSFSLSQVDSVEVCILQSCCVVHKFSSLSRVKCLLSQSSWAEIRTGNNYLSTYNHIIACLIVLSAGLWSVVRGDRRRVFVLLNNDPALLCFCISPIFGWTIPPYLSQFFKSLS